jgi:hypothetical protein
MRMHPLFGLLFCFLIFMMNPYLVPCDSSVKKIFISIKVALKKHQGGAYSLCFVLVR